MSQPRPDAWARLIQDLWDANPMSRLAPLSPLDIMRSFQQLPAGWTAYAEFAQRSAQIWTDASLKFWGLPTGGESVRPDAGDKRFAASDWDTNAAFDALKQTYLLAATTLLKAASDVDGLDAQQQRKVQFYVRQFVDAISPTNFAFTNPQVIHETVASGGRNLVTGMQNLMRDVAAGQVKMTDTDAFEPGRNLAMSPGQVVCRNALIELIQYAPTTPTVHAVPLLFIPPWINKFYILDLQPKNSLIRFLVERGFTVFVISWKNPDASMEDATFDDYLELGPVAALSVVKEITRSRQVNAVGYCIGGTLLSMALPYLAAKNDASVANATFLVSLQDFAEVGDTSVFIDEPQVAYMEQRMLERGYLDSRDMASMFNMLRANDLIWSNVVNNYLLGKEPPAFDLLYWNADGTRMARAAHSFYVRNTYLENNLIRPGRVALKGVPLDLGEIRQDVYAVGAEQDHIVPWRAAWRITQLTGGASRFVLAASGHIAGVISPPDKGRGYWTNAAPAATPEAWQEHATRQEGSWWTDWLTWLEPRSGKQVAPPRQGSKRHPPLAPAPGSYVLEK